MGDTNSRGYSRSLLLAMTMIMSPGGRETMSSPKPNEPDYSRKKCKSCKFISKYNGKCDKGQYTSPKSQACWQYVKRK